MQRNISIEFDYVEWIEYQMPESGLGSLDELLENLEWEHRGFEKISQERCLKSVGWITVGSKNQELDLSKVHIEPKNIEPNMQSGLWRVRKIETAQVDFVLKLPNNKKFAEECLYVSDDPYTMEYRIGDDCIRLEGELRYEGDICDEQVFLDGKNLDIRTHTIRMEAGFDVLQVFTSKKLSKEQEQEAYEWFAEGELECNWDYQEGYEYFLTDINEFYVDGISSCEHTAKGCYQRLKVPKKGLYATGGGVRFFIYFTLTLPKGKPFNADKLLVKSAYDIVYILDNGKEIKAKYKGDGDEKGEPDGGTYYCNGKRWNR